MSCSLIMVSNHLPDLPTSHGSFELLILDFRLFEVSDFPSLPSWIDYHPWWIRHLRIVMLVSLPSAGDFSLGLCFLDGSVIVFWWRLCRPQPWTGWTGSLARTTFLPFLSLGKVTYPEGERKVTRITLPLLPKKRRFGGSGANRMAWPTASAILLE